MWIFCSGALGKGKLFWFFSVGFVCWQKPNVLDRALAFYTDAQRQTVKKLHNLFIKIHIKDKINK